MGDFTEEELETAINIIENDYETGAAYYSGQYDVVESVAQRVRDRKAKLAAARKQGALEFADRAIKLVNESFDTWCRKLEGTEGSEDEHYLGRRDEACNLGNKLEQLRAEIEGEK